MESIHQAGCDARIEALRARYGFDAGIPATPANHIVDSLLGHRTVRSYLDTPLPEGTLPLLVAAAQSAATSSSMQAWSVVAVEDPARKERLSKLAADQPHIRQCPLLLVWLADLSRLDRVVVGLGQTPGGDRNFKHPRQCPARVSGQVCRGLEVMKSGFSMPVAVESAGLRAIAGRRLGLDVRADPDAIPVAPTRRAAPLRLQGGGASDGVVSLTAAAAQPVKCDSGGRGSRARALGGG